MKKNFNCTIASFHQQQINIMATEIHKIAKIAFGNGVRLLEIGVYSVL
jgi:hypothetical protein